MKIYEYKKEEFDTELKVLGMPLMEEHADCMSAGRSQKFLGGIITTQKVTHEELDGHTKEIKLLGKSFLKRVEKDNQRIYFLFDKAIFTKSLFDMFKKEYFKYFDKRYDDIYILRANSGETYLTLAYVIDILLKRNGSKNPLLVATKGYHIDLIKMLCPEIPYVYLKNWKVDISEYEFKIDNFRFLLFYPPKHFKKTELDIKNNPTDKHHYFKSILDAFNIDEKEISIRRINIAPEEEKRMLEKVSATGLNLDKFVFLTPEAQSCKLCDEDFWCELINKFQSEGYDVFVNLASDNVRLQNTISYKTCSLSLVEAFALAKRAKKIVSLRSGFTEILLQTEAPMDILYTEFRHRPCFGDMDVQHVMSGFGIAQLPFVEKGKIREIKVQEVSKMECIEIILNIIGEKHILF